MYVVEQSPLLWLVELSVYLLVLTFFQLAAGFLTLAVIRLNIPAPQSYLLVFSTISALTFTSAFICDIRTHMQAAMVGAVSMAFTVPLQAIATLYRHRTSSAKLSSSQPQYSNFLATVLRIAIPAAAPSEKNLAEHPRTQLMRGIFHLTISTIVSTMYNTATEQGRPFIDVVAAVMILSGAAGVLNLTSAVLGLLGERSASPFRAPFLSRSTVSFWAGRWNAPVSSALRAGVYEPLMSVGVHRDLAAFACFFVSGIAHEVILWYVGATGSRGHWLLFFIICGSEVAVERALRQRKCLPRSALLQWALTAVALYVPFSALFVPVAVRTGLAHNGVKALSVGRVFIRKIWVAS